MGGTCRAGRELMAKPPLLGSMTFQKPTLGAELDDLLEGRRGEEAAAGATTDA